MEEKTYKTMKRTGALNIVRGRIYSAMSKENQNKILTIPNELSMVRLLLILVIVWLYCVKEEYAWTAAVLALSGLAHIVDGYIARHFNWKADYLFDVCHDAIACYVDRDSDVCVKYQYCALHWDDDYFHDFIYISES